MCRRSTENQLRTSLPAFLYGMPGYDCSVKHFEHLALLPLAKDRQQRGGVGLTWGRFAKLLV